MDVLLVSIDKEFDLTNIVYVEKLEEARALTKEKQIVLLAKMPVVSTIHQYQISDGVTPASGQPFTTRTT